MSNDTTPSTEPVFGFKAHDARRVEEAVKRVERKFKNTFPVPLPPFPGSPELFVPVKASASGIPAGDLSNPQSGQVTICNLKDETIGKLQANGEVVSAVNYWTVAVPANALCWAFWWRGLLVVLPFNCGPSA